MQEELGTVYDFVNFWDDTEAEGDELDFEWINEQLKKWASAILVRKICVFSILGVIGLWNKIPCPAFPELVFALDNDKAVGHVVGEDRTAVSAGREDPSILFADGDDGVEVSFTIA